MIHPDDDALLRFLLETDEEEERPSLERHLEACPQCRERFAKIRRETDMLAGFDPDLPPLRVPMPKGPRLVWRRLSPMAAALVVGIALGYGLSRITAAPDRTVVASYLTRFPAPGPVTDFVVCESVDLEK
jgi:anti-sigma factor RsiW